MPELEGTVAASPTAIEPEFLPSPTNKRGGKWGRITTTLTAIALAAGCTSQASPHTEAVQSSRPPSAEATQEAKLPSVVDVINQLKKDKFVKKDGVIDISALQSIFSPDDYTESTYDYEKSAQVLEVVYDSETQTLRFKDQVPGGLKKELLYQLLMPIANNEVILKAAFEKGDLTRVVLRQEAYNKDDIKYDSVEGSNNYSYQPDDEAVYVYLPGELKNISQQKVTDTFRHEVIHSLTQASSLSEGGEKPKEQDLSQWLGVCQDLRDIAIDEAEMDAQDILKLMAQSRTLFTDPKIRKAFDDVYTALRNGAFNAFQPKSSDVVENFSAEVPECRAIGPWQSFIRLLKERGIERDTSFESDQIDDLASSLLEDWSDILANNTIYSQLSETAYHSEGKLGHPYDNWDELIASVSNVLLAYPETLAVNINRLDPKKRVIAQNLIQLVVIDLMSQVPQEEKFNNFHEQLLDAKQRFDDALSS